MPRSRNIKHSFFTDDELATSNSVMGRLLFIGLWCHADFKGDLEWRPERLKVQILPYDECDIKELAINLDKSGFISFYSDGEKVYLHVRNFERHQNPHKNEKDKGSDVPPFSEIQAQAVDLTTLTINRDKSGLPRDENGSNPADSLSLIPDSGTPNPDTPANKFTGEDIRLADLIFVRVKQVAPKTKEPNLERWADTIRLMREQDRLTHDEIEEVFLYANKDPFWAINIKSPSKLREQFATLHAKMTTGGSNASSQSGSSRYPTKSELADEAVRKALANISP